MADGAKGPSTIRPPSLAILPALLPRQVLTRVLEFRRNVVVAELRRRMYGYQLNTEFEARLGKHDR